MSTAEVNPRHVFSIKASKLKSKTLMKLMSNKNMPKYATHIHVQEISFFCFLEMFRLPSHFLNLHLIYILLLFPKGTLAP